jgi:tetratricopeptide (TPR) repeat protein
MTVLATGGVNFKRMGTRASLHPMIGILSAAPRLCACLALSAFICTGQSRAAQQQSSKTPNNMALVESLVQQGHLDEAKAALLEELHRYPANVDSYNLLGIIESNQQDYSDALASFEKALQLSPNSAKTHNNLGNFYITQKKPDLAEKEFRISVRLDPGNADGNYNLGVLLMARGVPAEAIPHFERVHPANLATSFNLLRAYFECKRMAEALRLANALSDANRENAQVHFTLGVLLASEKQYKPAILDLEKADALQPGTFEITYNLGKAYLRSADFPSADLALMRALNLKPDSPETLYLLGQVYANESRPRDALELLVRAHKMAPGDTDILYLLAQVSMSQSYYEDAVPLLESGLQLAPQRSDIRAALGQSYFMAGKVDQAIEQFKKLIEIEHSARSYAFLGISYRDMGRFDEARQTFQQGLKVNPHDATCLFNLGMIDEEKGDSASAESMFQQVLLVAPGYADALLELANLRIQAKRLPEAEEFLRKYVHLSRNPSAGYYKLGMVERSLHQMAAAERDLGVFRTLSKDVSYGPHHYEDLFNYLDNRSQLGSQAREQLDIAELLQHIKSNPGRPDDLYLLAEAYLKAGKVEDARATIEQLDKVSSDDYRTVTGIGVLLARYHMYDDAIQHFQIALRANPGSDEEQFDLANAYFHSGHYSEALDAASKVSDSAQKEEAFLALLGDIYEHLGDYTHAEPIFRDAIARNPDNDQDYLSLALLQLRESDVASAKQTLLKGKARIPDSGKLFWGLGIVSALDGDVAEAAQQLERSVDLLPEWTGSYSLLGVFYFQTGQIDKAKEVFDRFKRGGTTSGIDLNRIEQTLAQAQSTSPSGPQPMTSTASKQLLQFAFSLADRTL